jgi:anhydro-N-acetylmuramic acid kinase
MKKYRVIGIMSGTSLDGIDIAYCVFVFRGKKIIYQIVVAETIPYPAVWRQRLMGLAGEDALSFCLTHNEYGHYLGSIIRAFMEKHQLHPDFIASHGHTIFHQPSQGMTAQIGHGAAIAAETQTPVIADFRSLDVAYGGQGAPLVPVGDRLLFAKYAYCLNLGGFANISYDLQGSRVAYDICPCNTVLNFLAGKAGVYYDDEGRLARSGKVDEDLLQKMNELPYYQHSAPKSLGMEWVTRNIMPLLETAQHGLNDLLRTFVEHIAIKVVLSLKPDHNGYVLVTGGGANNVFLIERMRSYTGHEIVIPDRSLIDYKEALIFAYLGVLRMEYQPNSLQSVTGARQDSCGGAIYLP